jgi:hypothetical protein
VAEILANQEDGTQIISKNPSQKRAGGVNQGVGSEFKSQYHTHTHIKKQQQPWITSHLKKTQNMKESTRRSTQSDWSNSSKSLRGDSKYCTIKQDHTTTKKKHPGHPEGKYTLK